MAFTTINGATATDRVTFEGTDGVDILSTFNTLTAFVGAQEANDSITAQSPAGLIDWQVKAGAGNDTATFNSDVIGGRFNGNAGSDTLVFGNVLADAAVFGGQNNDVINTGTVAQSRLNGNLGNDTINVGTAPTVDAATGAFTTNGEPASLSQASIFGGQGSDTINVTFNSATDSEIGGNLGDDFINLYYDNGDLVSGLTVNGGEGNDTINTFYRSEPARAAGISGIGAGLTVDLGAGDDLINSSGRNDTIDGGAGDDTINGRNGADTMTGGAGRNTFVFASATQTTTVSGGKVTANDVITDFKAATTFDAAGAATNGDILDVAVATQRLTFLADTVDEAIAAALTPAAGGAGVHLVGIGSANVRTAYAIIANEVNGVLTAGAIQLGQTGVYTDTNYTSALSFAQVI